MTVEVGASFGCHRRIREGLLLSERQLSRDAAAEPRAQTCGMAVRVRLRDAVSRARRSRSVYQIQSLTCLLPSEMPEIRTVLGPDPAWSTCALRSLPVVFGDFVVDPDMSRESDVHSS